MRKMIIHRVRRKILSAISVSLILFTFLCIFSNTVIQRASGTYSQMRSVQEEWNITGTTTGISGAQTEEGTSEYMTEADTGTSSTQYKNVTENWDINGTTTNFANAQSATDGGLYANLTEVNTGGASNVITNGVFQSDTSSWTFVAAIGTPTGDWNSAGYANGGCARILSQIGRNSISEGYWEQTIGTTITAGSSATLSYAWKKTVVLGVLDAENIYVTIVKPDASTADLDGDTSAIHDIWTTVSNKDVSSFFDQTGTYKIRLRYYVDNPNDPDVQGTGWFDEVSLSVSTPDNYQMDIEFNTTSIPSGTSYTLELNYNRSDTNDYFWVKVWNGSAWNIRGSALDATPNGMNFWSITLWDNETTGQRVNVTFVDNGPTLTTSTELRIDYLRVRTDTTVVNFTLVIQHNITGIGATVTGYELCIKGNISVGGENFNVSVWDFTNSQWTVRLDQVFTTANEWHNYTLASDEISGGVVRIRFIDTVNVSDSTQNVLSIDYAGVKNWTASQLSVLGYDKAPGTVNLGQTNVLMLNLTLIVDYGNLTVSSLTVGRTGTADDANVSGVTLFNDTNGNGAYDGGIDVQLNTTQTFTDSYTTFGNLNFEVNNTTSRKLLILYNISASATSGYTVGANITGASSIAVSSPDTVAAFSTIWSTNSTITGVAITISAYGFCNYLDAKKNNTQIDVNQDYYFWINITHQSGWSNVDWVNVTAWWDGGDDTANNSYAVHNSSYEGGNLNTFLQYENTTGTAVFQMLWPDDEVTFIIGNCTETVIDANTHNLTLWFKPLNQTRWAPGDGGWDNTPGFNDIKSWNFEINASDSSGNYDSKKDEYGIYRYTNVIVSENWVGLGSVLPGGNTDTDLVTIYYSSNYNFNLTIWFVCNLTNQSNGDKILIENNVMIYAVGDLLIDEYFTGVGEANKKYIWQNKPHDKDNVSASVQVRFNVYVPLGTLSGEYSTADDLEDDPGGLGMRIQAVQPLS